MQPTHDYFYLARTSTSTIYKDELRLPLAFTWPQSLATPPYIYVDQHHTYVPYKVKKWHIARQLVTLSLNHLHLLNQPRQATQSYDLFLDQSWLYQQLKKTASLDALVFCEGFTVCNSQGQTLGEVKAIHSRQTQPLLLVSGIQELSIPIHPTYIQAIDFDTRRITLSEAYN